MINKLPTIYVVDDEKDVRDALRMLLVSIGHTVETFASAIDFLDQFEVDWPGCILADIRMPGMSGIELQEKLNAMGAPIPVIIISGHADVPMAVSVIQKGAMDLLEKPFSDQRLLDMVQAALNIDCDRRKSFIEEQQVRLWYEKLTAREKEIMNEVVKGKMNKVIAYDLDVTTRTVEMHRSRAMEKMHARSLAVLIHYHHILHD